MNKFKDFQLSEAILQALEKLGYQEPLDVQKQVIPYIRKKRDVIVQSQTGSGKTAAFAIPICDAIDWDNRNPQALVITPTRELALQIKEEMHSIGLYKRIRVAAVFGRQPYKTQLQELKQRVHAVVGTPGRLLDHLQRGTLITDDIRYLVLDEADEMLNMGFLKQVSEIIRQLPETRMTLLFSATMPEDIAALAKRYMHDPVRIKLQSSQLVADAIRHEIYDVSSEDKLTFLIKLLAFEKPESAIIFAKTQETVDRIAEALRRLEISVDKIHGGMMQEDRIKNMEAFRRGRYRILAATDVASRGIDIDSLTHVINYDFPVEAAAYVHRIGRTGRIGKQGKAISLFTEYDQAMREEIEALIKQSIEAADKSVVLTYQPTLDDLKYLQSTPAFKEAKNKELKKDVFTIYLNGGKNKKIRPGDIVGAITEIDGIEAEDIGIISVQEIGSYVDILNGKGPMVLKALQSKTIKGKILRIEKAGKRH